VYTKNYILKIFRADTQYAKGGESVLTIF